MLYVECCAGATFRFGFLNVVCRMLCWRDIQIRFSECRKSNVTLKQHSDFYSECRMLNVALARHSDLFSECRLSNVVLVRHSALFSECRMSNVALTYDI